MKSAPVWIYVPTEVQKAHKDIAQRLSALGAEVRASEARGDALDVPFAGKVFAAAKAEGAAAGKWVILAWLDSDTVILEEPTEFLLAAGASLGYRPVMHKNIGSLYAEQIDPYWSRVYEKLSVPPSAVFPMKTVADDETIRPYFNAGLLVVRPERGILRKWADAFPMLCRDAALVEMCRNDSRARLFLHQAALSGVILNLVKKNEMVQLSDRYNYPIFFKEMYGANREFHDPNSVATLRYDVYFQHPAPDWSQKLRGPAATVSWLKDRLGKGAATKGGASTKMRYRFEEGKGGRS
jgi:hypothetical protein